jgi:uncharacterized phage protein (TIGR01671 family)
MKRRILFRFWNNDEKKMEYFDLSSSHQKMMSWDGYVYRDGKIINGTLLQTTGTEDKNGQEIFEGDILKVPEGWSGDTRYKESFAEVKWIDDYNEACLFFVCPDDVSWEQCEVIGNIFENPTLMDYEDALKELDKKFKT